MQDCLSRDTQTLTELWRYAGKPGLVRDITPDEQTVLNVRFDIFGADDNDSKLVGHNVSINDLYVFNGGPQ